MVKFGDIVRDVKVTVNPEESGLERYVAGEHMETDDLHIRRWGTIGDGYLGPAFHRKFVKGQVLYGSRRTYLRKVAVTGFDGICANTTFVLEPKDNELLLELLPFIMQTESFATHAVKQSRGSVNPYVNFRDIAWYEVALPPKHEQQRIANILWAADELIYRTQEAFGSADKARLVLIPHLLMKGIRHEKFKKTELGEIPSNWEIQPLKNLCEFRTGKLDSNQAKENGMYPFFTCSPETLRIDKYSFDCEALLLAGNNAGGVYSVKYYSGKFDAYQRTYVITINDTETLSYPYLLLALSNSLSNLQKLSVGSATKYLTIGVLHNLKITVPPFIEQDEIVQKINSVARAQDNCKSQLEVLQTLKKRLIHDLLRQ